MNTNKILFIVIILLSFFASCKKDTVAPSVTLTPAMARDSLYDIMNSWYYWNDLMPVVNKNDYSDPSSLMDAMLYKPLDRWSFVTDYDEFIAQMQGSFVGHGFRIGVDDEDKARIMLIYYGSHLYTNGVRRGWIVKKINGTDPAPYIKNHTLTDLIGQGQEGITNTFLFGKPDGTEETIISTKRSFTQNSVILYDTLHLSTGVTGHLVFESFIAPSEYELTDAFAYFNATGVKDLILDLRYNSGGYLYIAGELASFIAGNSHQGSTLFKLSYNADHLDNNGIYPLVTTPYPLSLSRIVVITSEETASASECVMNGLKPYMDVISIGDTTDGKPVGMNGGDIGKKYFVAPITFKLVNKNDEGDYFDGIAPISLVSDDITHDFNDREELCLNAAINYLENGSAKTKSPHEFKRHPQFSEKPDWMKNAFILTNQYPK
jgi:carboxyl-terminal processing protease